MDLNDVEELCRNLPGAVRSEGSRFSMGVEIKGKHKGFCWTWMERTDPKKARVENTGVVAVHTPGLEAKEVLLSLNSDALFTEPHYNGYPAVLVRLDRIDREELLDLLIEGHRCVVPSRRAGKGNQP